MAAQTQPRLAIVDDDIDFLADIGIAADGVVTTSDPAVCLDWVRRGEIDALVTDLRMPGEGGVGFLQRAREIDPKLPLALWTGYKPDEHEERLLDALEAAVMSKTRHRLNDVVGYFDDLFETVPLQRLRMAERRIMELEELNRAWVRDMVGQLRQIPDLEAASIAGAAGRFTVAELIDDIENLRPRGIDYIGLWRDAQARVRGHRR